MPEALVFAVAGIVTFLSVLDKKLPKITQKISSAISRPTNEEVKKRKEKEELLLKQREINAVDEFAKYAKLDRKIKKLTDELKHSSKGRSTTALKINLIIKGLFHICQLAVFLTIIYTYRYVPLLKLPDGWFWPITVLVSFPTGVSGAVSVTFWLLVCRSVVHRTVKIINI